MQTAKMFRNEECYVCNLLWNGWRKDERLMDQREAGELYDNADMVSY